MNILITGAGGFVGRHLSALALSKKNVKVFGLLRPQRRRSHAFLAQGVRPVRADLLSEDSLLAVLRKVRPDRIYHLAGQSSVALSWKRPKQTFEVNAGGTHCLLEAVYRAKCPARILVTGSADEYGASARSGKPLDEKARLRPTNPYGSSKTVQELLADHYSSVNGLPIVCTRAFNHIGPGQSDAFVAAGFARQVALIEARKLKAPLAVGNLEAVRDFTDVRDVVRAYWMALEKGKAGEVYNVASGCPRKVSDILKYYLKASSVKIPVHRDFARLRPTDVPYLVGDARKLTRDTGWQPRIRFETSLRDILDDWRVRIRGRT